jgi:hypothetical protein
MENIIVNNALIAKYMGYIYFESGVLIDNSDCGGIFDVIDVYSKTPIQVDAFDGGQKYFSDVPNPDYKNENNPHWNNELETLAWSTLNSANYIHDLKYHSSWDWLMPVVEKIEKMDYGFKMCRKVVEVYVDSTKEVILKTKESCRFESLFKAVVEFIKWYNEKIK